MDLKDPMLENEASYPMLIRYINVALLCVQETAADRPTMSEVVSMLINEHINLPSPKQPAFSYLKSLQNSAQPMSRPGACSVNNVTLSLIEPLKYLYLGLCSVCEIRLRISTSVTIDKMQHEFYASSKSV
ncbi:hypothetical protein QYF36_016533 [Acer negundo]|nr:hypothetical protein QYF36_016533 [Acer negundo]